ncbi:MAG: hypothetical protein LH645_00505 [Actinomycetia bacterium]|nr:hypothetical protein [Actinomycetes bacterium]
MSDSEHTCPWGHAVEPTDESCPSCGLPLRQPDQLDDALPPAPLDGDEEAYAPRPVTSLVSIRPASSRLGAAGSPGGSSDANVDAETALGEPDHDAPQFRADGSERARRRYFSAYSALLVGTVTFIGVASWVFWPTAGDGSSRVTDPAPSSEPPGVEAPRVAAELRTEYIQRLEDNGVGKEFTSEASAVRYAKELCRRIDSTPTQVRTGSGLVAVSVYCPEHLVGGSKLNPQVRKALASSSASVVAQWALNEPPSATVANNANAPYLDANIGNRVKPGARVGGSRSYWFPGIVPNTGPPQPQRLVRVADTSALDPGSDDYAVTIRYRTTHRSGIVMQKGQARTPGGFWNLQQTNGVLLCQWSGSKGQATVSSVDKLNDGRWHDVRCERSGGLVALSVDGAVSDFTQRQVGLISNDVPFVIGGKPSCTGVATGCEYFVGWVDYVRIESS